MIATESRIFTSEDEIFAWLNERGFDVLDCTGEAVVIERSNDLYTMVSTLRYQKLDDGRVELI